MKTILVKNGKVVNIIKSDSSFNSKIRELYDHLEEVEDTAYIDLDADFDGLNYINPVRTNLDGYSELDNIKKQEIDLIEDGFKAIKVGQKAKHLMVGYIKSMGLPKDNRKQFRQNMQSIIQAVDIGSIDIAIDEIKTLTEDGTVITASSKVMILKVFEDAGYDIT